MPHVGKRIMDLHYSKHHKSYVDNFNKALTELTTAIQKQDTAGILGCLSSLKFNGGGHANHALFWKILSPIPEKGGVGGVPPTGKLVELIDRHWGNFETFKGKFNNVTGAIQGSGWGWLVRKST